MSELPIEAARSDVESPTNGADHRVSALCDQVRKLAEAAGDEAQRALAQQATQLLAGARSRAEAESRHELERQGACWHKDTRLELQSARLEARARLAAVRWSQLDRVLDEAEREVGRIREREKERYSAAIVRWFEQARAQLPAGQVVVRANAEDLRLLRGELGERVDGLEGDLQAGLVVSTPDGHVVCDQTLARRRSRRETELRLAAADILFGEEATGDEGGGRPTSEIEWCHTLAFAGNLVTIRGACRVGFDEQAEIIEGSGTTRVGQTLTTSETEVVVQVFEGTRGLARETTGVRFLGRVPELVVSEALLGRIFDGLGRPRDGGPPLLGHRRDPLRGLPLNPVAREYPREFIQTGISSIDVLNSLVRGQKLPIFTGAGLPHQRLLSQILRQARLLEETSSFALILVGMGISHTDARFFHDVFRDEGVMERASMFLNLADDPPMARLAAPRVGLTAAEHLAFDHDYHVLVILTDMTNYASALREIATARDEVPARKGYPGYLYSDLAEIYERAGRVRGRAGSITLIPVVTLPNDDITHPVPDLTGYITEGQLILSRDMHGRGIAPPVDVLPSLSRLMKDGIGPAHTRDDHPNLANQLYAAYAEGRRVRDLATVVGEADLAEVDKLYLKFAEAFEERFISQGFSEERSVLESLDLGWSLLQLLPEDELSRVTQEQIATYGRQSRQGRDG